MKARRTTVFIIIAALLAVYAGGYISARRNYRMVHYISYVDGSYTMHDVAGGDAQLFGSTFNGYIALFCTPLRYVEIAFWHIAHPLGSHLTVTHRQRAGV